MKNWEDIYVKHGGNDNWDDEFDMVGNDSEQQGWN